MAAAWWAASETPDNDPTNPVGADLPDDYIVIRLFANISLKTQWWGM